MLRHMVKSKIERVMLTETNLNYQGSIGIDPDFLEQADILVGEKVQVLNLNNGERLETYVILEPRGSKNIILYGPAARKGMKGDLVTIISYMLIDDAKARDYIIKVVS
ncbi:MAG: aspartate 1-decarboxylase [bacterium]|nr:aspartate 1-decarboxylase [bacterium]